MALLLHKTALVNFPMATTVKVLLKKLNGSYGDVDIMSELIKKGWRKKEIE